MLHEAHAFDIDQVFLIRITSHATRLDPAPRAGLRLPLPIAEEKRLPRMNNATRIDILWEVARRTIRRDFQVVIG